MAFFIFISMWVITVIGVFSRGLYFDSSFYPVHLCIQIFFIVFILRQVLYKEDDVKPLLGFVLMPLLYFLPFFFDPASKLLSMTTFLRSVSYLAFFLMLYWSLKMNKKFIEWLPYLIQTIGLFIAGHMILAKIGMLDSYYLILNRYAGVFEYPNTFGLIMATFFISSLLSIDSQKSIWHKIIFLSPLPIYLAMLIGSNSRAVMLLLPIVLFIAILLVPFKKQVYLLVMSIISMLSAFIINGLIENEQYILTFVLIIVLSVAFILVDRLLLRMPDLELSRKYMRFILPASLIILGLIVIVDLVSNGLIYQTLPNNVQVRVDHFGQIETFRERGLFIVDGLRLSKDNLFFGNGGRTWEMNYRMAQTYPYQSTESHNGFIEMILDIGWVGLIVFFSLITPLMIRLIKGYNQTLTKYVIPVLLIILHSLLDFNFSFGLVWLIFLAMVAAILAKIQLNESQKWLNYRFVYPICLSILALFSIVTITYSYRFIQADSNFNNYKQSGDTRLLEASSRLNPYDPEIRLNVLEEHLKRNLLTEAEIIYEADAIAKLEISNSRHLSEIALLLNAYGNSEPAYQLLNEALKVDRMESRLYEVISDLAIKLFQETNDRHYLESNRMMFEDVEDFYRKLINREHFNVHNAREFVLSDLFIERMAATYYLLDELESLEGLTNYLSEDHQLYDVLKEFHETGDEQKLIKYFSDTMGW